jgi:superfamily II DNA or RNA helicase
VAARRFRSSSELPFDAIAAPVSVHEIIQVILDRGRLTKDEIRLLWDLSEVDYAALREALEREKLIEPGAPGTGGFIARFGRRPMPEDPTGGGAIAFPTEYERRAAERLAEVLNHQDLETLLGHLLYTLRRARRQSTGEDRRGTKLELAAALLTRHGVDLFAAGELRKTVAKRLKVAAPSRWNPGKSTALRFVIDCGFPEEYAGIPAPETPPDFEYLEGRVDLPPLQDFQREVQGKLLEVLGRPGGRAILTLPTGAGKTRTAVDTIRDWLGQGFAERRDGRGNTVLWLAHTEELCEQAYACFRDVWQASSSTCPILLFRFWGRYTNDLERHRETLLTLDKRPTVFVSTPQRLVRLIEATAPDSVAVLQALLQHTGLVVVDEAHRAAAPSYRAIVQRFAGTQLQPVIIGLTATPFRQEYDVDDPLGGTKELHGLFQTIIEPARTLGPDPRAALQERGYLAQPIFSSIKTNTMLRAPLSIDLDNLNDDDIDKIDYALKLRADRPDRRMLVLERLVEICAAAGSLVIYFGPTVQDAECMAFLLRQRGIEASFVGADTRDVSRRKIIADFKSGEIQVLCNCEVLTTGFDAPRVTHVVLARPTVSQVLYEQMVGRGLRGERFGGTASCHIIDLEDNYRTERLPLGYQRFRAIWRRGNR